MPGQQTERVLLDEAVLALGEQTAGRVRVVGMHGTHERGFDAKLDLELHGQTLRFLVEIRNVDRRPALAQIKAQLETAIRGQYADYLPLLIAPYMTETMAEECRRLNLAFVDTAGNLFIRTATTMLYIIGRRRPAHTRLRPYQVTTPAGMKTLFALLCQPNLAGCPYRQIAQEAQVALGTVGPVLDDLETRGFLRRKTKTHAKLQHIEELMQEWVVQYPATLRPKLNGRKYTGDRDKLLKLDVKNLNVYWGGEVAAAQMTGYLQPEQLLLYTRETAKELLIQGRMRLDAAGNVEILAAFWNRSLDRDDPQTVPPLLVYADLMMTGDTRNIETAKILYERYLQPTATTR